MSLRRLTSLAVGAALAATAMVAVGQPASAKAAPTGTTSIASVLAADGDTFDRNPYDYDILHQAVLAVLDAKPGSDVAVLADGTVPLTVFAPNDLAFRFLLYDLTKQWPRSEEAVLTGIANGVGIDAVETVLLYHVVPGLTIDSAAAVSSDGAALPTAQGGTVTVDVLSKRGAFVRLIDNDPNDLDPFLIRRQLDINKGNQQIAHGISFVLRPIDL